MDVRLIARVFSILLLFESGAIAQMVTEGNPGSGALMKVRNTGTQMLDGVALHAESKPQPYYGIGVLADGGYMGIKAVSTISGTGTRYGGYFEGSGASSNYGISSTAYGGTFSYAGYFSGNVHVTGTFTSPSDSRLKTGVQQLQGGLSTVLALQPATYFFDTTRVKVKGLPGRRQTGFMANELKEILPDLVQDIPLEPKENGRSESEIETYQSVNYVGLIPVLVSAIKEQQAQIQVLQAELNSLKRR